jgi:hypothetical protein
VIIHDVDFFIFISQKSEISKYRYGIQYAWVGVGVGVGVDIFYRSF